MPVMSVQLTGINISREPLSTDARIKNIQNNVLIKDVKLEKVNLGDLKKGLIFSFLFKSDYLTDKPKETKFGSLELNGEVLFVDEEVTMTKIAKQWTKSKKIEENILVQVLQSAFEVTKVEAIYLARKVLLPSPIELPIIKPQGSNQGYIG